MRDIPAELIIESVDAGVGAFIDLYDVDLQPIGGDIIRFHSGSRDIIGAATRCLDAIWKDGHRYQKAGVMLGDFFSQGVVQLNMFDDNSPRHNSSR